MSYAEAFLDGLPPELRRGAPSEGGRAELETALQELVARCARTWPAVALPASAFLRHLAERLPARGRLDRALAEVHAEDLYLACACGRGDPKALALFEQRFMPAVERYVAHADSSAAFAAEVRQLLRMQLLVARADGPPRIADFTGRGPLAAWLRMSAVRTVQQLRRRHKPKVALDQAGLELRAVEPDPEMQYLKGRYGRELKEAFQRTLAALPRRERNILRLHFLDGLTTTAIGEVYKVHNSTVSRWLATIRRDILAQTRALLQQRLQLDTQELESLFGMLQTSLDISICKFLETAGEIVDRS
jgi:RNA polymerase sigma-70 factor, ECF subfamily